MEARDWHRHYDAGVPATLEYERLSLPAALRRCSERFGARPALVFHGETLTWAQLQRCVDCVAAALAPLGVTRGSRVAIALPNVPQTVIAYYAALALGAQVVMTNPLYTDDELEHQWQDAGCTLAFVLDTAFAQRLCRLGARVPVRHWVVCSFVDMFPWPKRWLARRKLQRSKPPLAADVRASDGVTPFRTLLRAGVTTPVAAGPDFDDVAMLQYTGGTTGRAKAALLTHANIACNAQQVVAWFRSLQPGHEAFLAALPYFHVFGVTVCLNLPMWLGAKIVLLPDPRNTAEMLALIARERVSVLALVPAMFGAITRHERVERFDLGSVKGCFSGSAPLAPDTLARFEQLTGARIFEGYGLTETAAATHVNPVSGLRKIGTVGMPLPDVEARVVDSDDGVTELPVGAEGELLLRGPQVMTGYWNRPEETAEALRDGWFHTGDLASRDEDGYFRIVGRKKEMIVVGGYKVYPDEVDRVLAGHPAVAEAATIGVPDPVRGELVKSFVVRRPEAALSEPDLLAYCREHLAAYKVPRELEFRELLPRSTMLKVLRRELLQQELQRRADLARESGKR